MEKEEVKEIIKGLLNSPLKIEVNIHDSLNLIFNNNDELYFELQSEFDGVIEACSDFATLKFKKDGNAVCIFGTRSLLSKEAEEDAKKERKAKWEELNKEFNNK